MVLPKHGGWARRSKCRGEETWPCVLALALALALPSRLMRAHRHCPSATTSLPTTTAPVIAKWLADQDAKDAAAATAMAGAVAEKEGAPAI